MDFGRITAALSGWDKWCGGWSQAAAEHAQLGSPILEQGRTRSAGAHLAQAAVYYHLAKFLFTERGPTRTHVHLGVRSVRSG